MKSTSDTEPHWITSRVRTRCTLSEVGRDTVTAVARRLGMPKDDVLDALLRAHSLEDLVCIVSVQRDQDALARLAWSRGRV